MHPSCAIRFHATRFPCLAGECISKKLEKPKGMCLPTFALIRRVPAKIVRDKCTLIIKTPVRPSQPWYTQLFRLCLPDSTLIPTLKPESKLTPIVSELYVGSTSMECLQQQHCAEGLSGQTLNYLKVAEDRTRCIITEQGNKSRVAGVFHEKLIPFV